MGPLYTGLRVVAYAVALPRPFAAAREHPSRDSPGGAQPQKRLWTRTQTMIWATTNVQGNAQKGILLCKRGYDTVINPTPDGTNGHSIHIDQLQRVSPENGKRSRRT